MNVTDRLCRECRQPATQRVTVLIDDARLLSQSYCTAHAVDVTEELAHGEPPNVSLVAVVAITENWLRTRE